MDLSEFEFFEACKATELSPEKSRALWNRLQSTQPSSGSLLLTSIIYYLGASIVIIAMGWFMDFGWELFGGLALLFTALFYGLFSFGLGAWLWQKKAYRIPAGLLLTIAVMMAPLFIYGFASHFGLWPESQEERTGLVFFNLNLRHLAMEVATLITAAASFRFFPFSSLLAPLFFAAWLFALDLAPLLFDRNLSSNEESLVSLLFGLICLGIGYKRDLQKEEERIGNEDYAFWSYLVGGIAFWFSLSYLIIDKGEWLYFFYLLVNLLMILFSAFLQRMILLLLGSIGVFIYASHLAYSLFQNSVLFPLILSLLGFALIYLGYLYQKHLKEIEERLLKVLPESLKKYFPLANLSNRSP